MKKINTNINRPKITSEEIAVGKNFNQLHSNYTKVTRPFYKKGWFIANTLILSAAILTVVFFLNNDVEQQITTTDQPIIQPITSEEVAEIEVVKEEQPFIVSPIKGLNVPFSSYAVQSTKGRKIEHKTGSFIKVPKDAFVDDNGSLVKGKVEIKYREFKDIAEIFASGIPMTYDSAGTEYHFESAGMVEILAFQNGEPVFMNPEKKIDIEMTSAYGSTKYNLYTLDTINRTWVYEGKDKVIVKGEEATDDKNVVVPIKDNFITELKQKGETPQTNNELKTIKEEIVVIQKDIDKMIKEKPQVPQKATESRFRVDLDVLESEFPEISDYKNQAFEIGDENKNFDPTQTNKEWNDIELSKNEEGKFLLTLRRALSSKELKKIKKGKIKADFSGDTLVFVDGIPNAETKKTDLKKDNGNGSIKGKLTDKTTKEPLPFAMVVVYKGEELITSAQTDFEGKYSVSDLPAGVYDLEAKYVSYASLKKTNIMIKDNYITFVDLAMEPGMVTNFDTTYVTKKGDFLTLPLDKEGLNEERTFIVYPVFAGKDYKVAMATFNQKFEGYTAKLNERKEDERLKKEAYEKKLAEIKAENERRQIAWDEANKNRTAISKTNTQVYRAFSAYRFGTLNCDSPIRRPKGQTVLASFTDEVKEKLNIANLYLVEKSRNAVFPYYGQGTNLTFNPRADNYIIGVTTKNQLVTFTQKQFKSIPRSTREHDFDMQVEPVTPTSIKALKKCITAL